MRPTLRWLWPELVPPLGLRLCPWVTAASGCVPSLPSASAPPGLGLVRSGSGQGCGERPGIDVQGHWAPLSIVRLGPRVPSPQTSRLANCAKQLANYCETWPSKLENGQVLWNLTVVHLQEEED